MGVNTIYKCDRCGSEQDTPKQFWSVGIISAHYPDQLKSGSVHSSFYVCRGCLESLGIYRQIGKEKDLPAPPTIEELIIEILQRVGGI